VAAGALRLDSAHGHDTHGRSRTRFGWVPPRRNSAGRPTVRSIAYPTCCMFAAGDGLYVVPVPGGGVAPRLLTGQPHPTFEPGARHLWDAAGTGVYFTDRNTVWAGRCRLAGNAVSLATLTSPCACYHGAFAGTPIWPGGSALFAGWRALDAGVDARAGGHLRVLCA